MKLVDFRRLASPQFARKNPVLSRKYSQLRANTKSVHMHARFFDLFIRQKMSKAPELPTKRSVLSHMWSSVEAALLGRAVRISCNLNDLKLVSLDCQAGLAMLKAIPDNAPQVNSQNPPWFLGSSRRVLAEKAHVSLPSYF